MADSTHRPCFICSSFYTNDTTYTHLYTNVFQQEEDEERRKRLEEEELAKCTFTPQTKWRLAAERRRKARDEAQRAAEEARFRSPHPKLSVSPSRIIHPLTTDNLNFSNHSGTTLSHTIPYYRSENNGKKCETKKNSKIVLLSPT